MFRRRLIVGLMALVGVMAVMAAILMPGGTGSVEANPASVAGGAMGYYHSCALFDFGAPPNDYGVKCWGDNEYGQVGDGSIMTRTAPVTVRTATDPEAFLTSGISKVVGGWEHTCALTTTGGVKCWGQNEYGQLGYDPTDQQALDDCSDPTEAFESCSRVAVDVPGLPVGLDVIDIVTGSDGAARSHTCALLDDDTVRCWGYNGYGALGDGTTTDSYTPVQVCAVGETAPCTSFLDDVISLGGGVSYNCALVPGGKVSCWGMNNDSYSYLGVGQALVPDFCDTSNPSDDQSCSLVPLNVCSDATTGDPPSCTALTGATKLGVGGGHNCVVTTDDEVECWGLNLFGGVGNGTFSPTTYAQTVCASGSGPTCTVLEDVDVVILSGNAYHTCAITLSDVLKCWGFHSRGQLGIEGLRPSPMVGETNPGDVDISSVTSASMGGLTTCAITTADPDDLQCWGDNRWGQIGDGSYVEQHAPVTVRFLVDIADEDGDGCLNVKEWGLDETKGGLRDPFNPSDFYDVAINGGAQGQDGKVDLLNDVVQILQHDDPYDAYYDRSAADGRSGPYIWNMNAADGDIIESDVVAALAQVGHDCN